jgi:hypothetical protein
LVELVKHSDGESSGTVEVIKDGMKRKEDLSGFSSDEPLHSDDSLFTSASQKELMKRSPTPLFLPEDDIAVVDANIQHVPTQLPDPTTSPYFPFPEAHQTTKLKSNSNSDLAFLDDLVKPPNHLHLTWYHSELLISIQYL